MDKYEDIDKFINLFTKLKKEKELEDPPKVQLKIYEKNELNLAEDNNNSSYEENVHSESNSEEDNSNNNSNKNNNKKNLKIKNEDDDIFEKFYLL